MVLIAELQNALATVKSETSALVNENLALKQQLEPKQAAASQPGSDLQFRDGAYWYTTPAGQSDGPYCPRCKEADNRLVILSKPGDQFVGLFKWRCPQCDKTYT